MCSDGWNYPRKGEPVDGECPDCGEPICGGIAASGCNYSPCVCETCGACPQRRNGITRPASRTSPVGVSQSGSLLLLED
jgi:hypothetical protein